MPAIRFFALLESGRKIHLKNEAWRAVHQIDAASVGLGDGKYYEDLRKFYLNLAMPQESGDGSAKRRALDPTSEDTATLVKSLFEQAQRFN